MKPLPLLFFYTLIVAATTSCNGQKHTQTLVQLTKEQEEIEFNNCNCVQKNIFSISEMRRFYPFSKSFSIKLTSFVETPDSSQIIATGGNRLPIKDGKIDYYRLNEVIELKQNDIDSLAQILYNITYKQNPTIKKSSCFNPKHAIIFTDSSGIDFSYIEICFECTSYKASPRSLLVGDFCNEKYEILSEFFRNRKIKQGFSNNL